ncbi:hypothetical protein [Pseudobacteriovorax antillogorgiicola]|uniref:Uncharacterized protein n=1 Tax=Pseudobacteriovorax antillogorgiicola TaxID=1513793 RepID=A0A1Y6CCU9_9BACT|nr:hypothetical protein [Pseudobacteriovorax antillogorgiicola]TCS48653.1 hypothetical protein EDD56_11775 [Pseudobacteriovorax antillogorgiicola]SMF55159.1 hypothetical protein SAMN06296036_11784 [Pseudobacteriovorax antillogorgiicola]
MKNLFYTLGLLAISPTVFGSSSPERSHINTQECVDFAKFVRPSINPQLLSSRYDFFRDNGDSWNFKGQGFELDLSSRDKLSASFEIISPTNKKLETVQVECDIPKSFTIALEARVGLKVPHAVKDYFIRGTEESRAGVYSNIAGRKAFFWFLEEIPGVPPSYDRHEIARLGLNNDNTEILDRKLGDTQNIQALALSIENPGDASGLKPWIKIQSTNDQGNFESFIINADVDFSRELKPVDLFSMFDIANVDSTQYLVARNSQLVDSCNDLSATCIKAKRYIPDLAIRSYVSQGQFVARMVLRTGPFSYYLNRYEFSENRVEILSSEFGSSLTELGLPWLEARSGR